MSNPTNSNRDARDLVITRLIKAPRAAVWRAWSEPDLLAQWWCPRPWTTEVRGFDLRPGGDFYTFMSGPDGGTSDNPGSFLEVVPGERLVITSLLTSGWRPATPWMPFTAVITLADEADGTRYTATVMHPDQSWSDKHLEMGFYEGWGAAIDQLDELVRELG